MTCCSVVIEAKDCVSGSCCREVLMMVEAESAGGCGVAWTFVILATVSFANVMFSSFTRGCVRGVFVGVSSMVVGGLG